MLKFLQQFSKYGFVAAAAAVADWIVFGVLIEAFGVHYIYAQMASRVAGGILSFTSNKYWSFKSGRSRRFIIEGRRFLVLYAVSYSLAISLLYMFTDVLGLSPYVSKILTDVLCFMLNFLVMNHYVFHTRDGLSQLVARRLK